MVSYLISVKTETWEEWFGYPVRKNVPVSGLEIVTRGQTSDVKWSMIEEQSRERGRRAEDLSAPLHICRLH